ncbi:hypothetical protein JG688_00008014 [Phytophthora aleatoria]|uniref:Uncharacterized protein n=1 Tax=Phytophthora aleatoria TaxID=2496075 RepID=A0A8J5M4K4_9STRA|nr:hypothetical protein JG688_00008014 [Phytophthora aleatoria]
MARKLWTPEELWWLVQAWEEAMNAAKRVGGKKRKMSTSEFHKLIHERFVELAGGSSPRTVATIVIRKDVLQNSYEFIRSFLGNKETSGGLDWFALTTSDQRELMKTAGGKRVQPIEERVFTALEKVLKDESAATEQSDESEGEDSGNEGYSSEGDKFEKGMRQKKKEVPAPKKVDKRHLSRSSGGKASKSALEEESGELLSQKEEGHAKKKRHKPSTPKVGMKDILERQSGVLAGFLEKRADERSQEHERSRQEREADQKFWAAETAKDRALLRELFTSK